MNNPDDIYGTMHRHVATLPPGAVGVARDNATDAPGPIVIAPAPERQPEPGPLTRILRAWSRSRITPPVEPDPADAQRITAAQAKRERRRARNLRGAK